VKKMPLRLFLCQTFLRQIFSRKVASGQSRNQIPLGPCFAQRRRGRREKNFAKNEEFFEIALQRQEAKLTR
jgi:hypothetical protein